jgi:hypothetical protein
MSKAVHPGFGPTLVTSAKMQRMLLPTSLKRPTFRPDPVAELEHQTYPKTANDKSLIEASSTSREGAGGPERQADAIALLV